MWFSRVALGDLVALGEHIVGVGAKSLDAEIDSGNDARMLLQERSPLENT